ncbi:MAG: site-2 protease family protein [Acidimicrobiia bacterium]
MNTDFEQAVIFFACLIVAVILHEVSHGLVASWFGDDTAKRAGRLTLNPIPHIDPVGSIVMPAMGALIGVPVLAWAKPVPVNPNRMRDPRRDMVFVSLAGPITNFLLMAVAALAAKALYTTPVSFFNDLPLGIQILFSFALVNLFLGIFNLVPIPPLDGSALIERVLPETWLPGWYKFRPYGFLVLFILVFTTGFAGRILAPFADQLTRFVFA